MQKTSPARQSRQRHICICVYVSIAVNGSTVRRRKGKDICTYIYGYTWVLVLISCSHFQGRKQIQIFHDSADDKNPTGLGQTTVLAWQYPWLIFVLSLIFIFQCYVCKCCKRLLDFRFSFGFWSVIEYQNSDVIWVFG